MNYDKFPLTLDTIGTPHKYPTVGEFLTRIQDSLQLAKRKLQQATDWAKFYANQKRSPRSFEKG